MMRKALIVMVILFAAAGAMTSASAASGPAARAGLAGLEQFELLSADHLGGLDGMGGSYLDSLPQGVLEQLAQMEDLEKVNVTYIDTSEDSQVGTVGIWDSAFEGARGIMALVQIAGNDNMVDMHLHLNIFLGGTFYGDIVGDWIDLSGFVNMSSL